MGWVAVFSWGGAVWADDFARLESQRDYKKTVSEMRKQIREKGWDLQKNVDHSKAAKSFGENLKPASVFLISKPFYVSVLVAKAPSVSVDIPFPVAVYEDDGGKTWVMYRKPETFLKDHGVDGSRSDSLKELQKKLEGELEELVEAAIKEAPKRPTSRK